MANLKVLELQAAHAANLAESLRADMRTLGIADNSIAGAYVETMVRCAVALQKELARPQEVAHQWGGAVCENCGALRDGALSRLRCGVLTHEDRAQGEEAMTRG